MNQSIKSLTEQTKNVSVNGFTITKLKKGDYGYNLIYGVVDDEIEVAFRIDYFKDDDKNATSEIERILNDNVNVVRLISKKFSPEGSKLVKFIDGWILTEYEIGYIFDGKRIDFNVPKCYWLKNQLNKPPIGYGDETVVIMKKLIDVYVRQLKRLMNIKNFELSEIELSDSRVTVEEKEKLRYVQSYVVTGKFFDKEISFIVENLEKENIKKRVKREFAKERKKIIKL